MVLNDTSVTVSWNEVQDFSIDYYTVVYSQVTEGQNGEKSARFPPPAISGVITDLDSTAIYQFQVVATVTVGNITLEGDGNAALRFGVGKLHVHLYDRCMGIQRYCRGLHIPCSTVKSYNCVFALGSLVSIQISIQANYTNELQRTP